MKKVIFSVGDLSYVSLCANCEFIPSGKVPQNNQEVLSAQKEKPSMYCVKKAYFPDLNFDNSGKSFYDVAKCDQYKSFNGEPLDEVPAPVKS